jgi:predicted protein tyrosine phosphatase
MALRLLGAIHTEHATIDLEPARDHFASALALAERLEMRPLVAHCHAGLARLYLRAGKRREAAEYFTAASAMYRDMGMTHWLEKAEAEMAEFER